MQKVFRYMEQYDMIHAGDHIIVGVSGGADSLCLLFVLRDYCRIRPFTMSVVHVEHGIRGEESLADARFVKDLCDSLGIACRCVSCPVPALAKKKKISLEEAGREARYEILERVRRETGADKIAVAHHREDQAETMLFQMVRGSGLDGACGMPPVRGRIIRPLLGCSRAWIEDYLTRHGIAWRQDATNRQTDYRRNCLRHQVLPLLREKINSAADEHLFALAGELQMVRAYMTEQAKRIADEIAVCSGRGAQIKIPLLLEQDEILRRYSLREILRRAGCPLKNVGRGHVEAVLSLCTRQSGRSVTLPDGWRAQRRFDCIVLRRGEKEKPGGGFLQAVEAPGEYKIGERTFRLRVFPNENKNILQKTYTKWLDYDKISRNLFIRTRRPGDYIVIDRNGNRKKLKAYLIEEKIPAAQRGDTALLAMGSEILWVVGHRISEAYKVLPQTKYILEVQMTGGFQIDGEDNDSDTRRSGGTADSGARKKDQ